MGWIPVPEAFTKYGITPSDARSMIASGEVKSWNPPPSFEAPIELSALWEEDVERWVAARVEDSLTHDAVSARAARQAAKALNFGTIYGGGAKSLREIAAPEMANAFRNFFKHSK